MELYKGFRCISLQFLCYIKESFYAGAQTLDWREIWKEYGILIKQTHVYIAMFHCPDIAYILFNLSYVRYFIIYHYFIHFLLGCHIHKPYDEEKARTP